MTARLVPGPAPATIETPRGRIEYADIGSGPVVLALHGGMGGYDQSLLLARALLRDLPAHRVIAVSRPGYLGTPLEGGVTPQEQAETCAALLDSLGLTSVAVAAVSAGGPAALCFASGFPARCSALVLVSACSGLLRTPPEVLRRLPAMRALAKVPGVPSFLAWRVQRAPEAAAARAIRDPATRERTLRHQEAGPLLQALQCSVFNRLVDRFPGTLNDIEQFRTLPQLPIGEVVAPTLIVHGDADRIVPFAHAKEAAQRIPHARLLSIDGGEHVSLFTHLDLIRETASSYFR